MKATKKATKADEIERVFSNADRYATNYVTRGRDRIIGKCQHGCEHSLFQSRLQGMAGALACMDPLAVLNAAISALESSEEESDRILAGALMADIEALPPDLIVPPSATIQ